MDEQVQRTSRRPHRSTDGAVSWPAIKRYFPGTSPDSSILVVPGYGLVYVKNPKAGCSTLVAWLDRLHTGDHDAALAQVHKDHRLPRAGEVGHRRVVRMLSGAAYRFSFVRHPLRRFESVYWDKLVHAQNTRRFRTMVRAELGMKEDPDTPLSFEQFLTAVEQQDPLTQMNRHWRPQHVNLLHPLVSYDRVGRLETFAADLELIREEAGLPHVPIQVRNASALASKDSVFTGRPDLVRRVERIYATDFDLYGY